MTTVFCSRQAVAEKSINKTAPRTTVILTTAGNPVRTNDLSIFYSLDFTINITNRPEISNSFRTQGISLAKPLHSHTDTDQAIRTKRYGLSATDQAHFRPPTRVFALDTTLQCAIWSKNLRQTPIMRLIETGPVVIPKRGGIEVEQKDSVEEIGLKHSVGGGKVKKLCWRSVTEELCRKDRTKRPC